ncbi:MAG: Kelch repeat-containing protein, partial [Planctomycetota bacterium]
TLTPGPNTPPPTIVGPTATGVTVLQLAVTAGPDEQVRFESLRFREYGTALAQTAIASLGLYIDADGDGAYAPAVDTTVLGTLAAGYDANDTATFAGLDRILHPGSTELWILVYSLSGTGAVGETFLPSVDAAVDITAAGGESGRAAVIEGLPLSGNGVTLQNVGSLTVSAGANNPPDATLPLPPTTASMLQVRLEAGPVEDVNVTGVTITTGGSGNAGTDVSLVQLYNDLDGSGTVTAGDTQIGTAASLMGNQAVFTGLAETIAAGPAGAEDWLVVYTFSAGNTGDTFTASLTNNADVSAQGAASGGLIMPVGAPVTGNTMTIGGMVTADLAVTDLTLIGQRRITPIESDHVMLHLRFSAGTSDAVTVNSLTFHATGTGNDLHDISSVCLFRETNADGILQKGVDPLVTPGTYGKVYSADDGSLTFDALSLTIAAGASEELLLVYYMGGSGTNNNRFIVSHDPSGDATASGVSSGLPPTITGAPIVSPTSRIQPTPDWTRTFASAPGGYAGEHGHTAVYDEVNRRIILFGGVLALAPANNDTWQIDLTAAPLVWNQIAMAGPFPPARHGHSAVYVPPPSGSGGGPKMLVFGGWQGGAAGNDLFELDMTAGQENWASLTPTGSPPPARCYHIAVWDAAGQRMVVFGGSADEPNIWGQPATRTMFNDVWVYDASANAWSQITTGGTPPAGAGRAGHTALYDALGARMILFGGCDYSAGGSEVYYNDIHELDLNTWQWRVVSNTGTPPSIRYLPSAVVDEIGRRMFVFGGGTDNPPSTPSLSNDIFVYNLSASGINWPNGPWNRLPQNAPIPAARYNHAAVYDPIGSRPIQIGGQNTMDVWEYK